jgi:hypothetical protein
MNVITKPVFETASLLSEKVKGTLFFKTDPFVIPSEKELINLKRHFDQENGRHRFKYSGLAAIGEEVFTFRFLNFKEGFFICQIAGHETDKCGLKFGDIVELKAEQIFNLITDF